MNSEIKSTLSEKEFCAAVGISRTTAYRLRKVGKLPYCRVGSRVLYLLRHIEEFLAHHEISVKPKLMHKIGFLIKK